MKPQIEIEIDHEDVDGELRVNEKREGWEIN
jgi:hypothetical protein